MRSPTRLTPKGSGFFLEKKTQTHTSSTWAGCPGGQLAWLGGRPLSQNISYYRFSRSQFFKL
jgi:hypothetical protein